MIKIYVDTYDKGDFKKVIGNVTVHGKGIDISHEITAILSYFDSVSESALIDALDTFFKKKIHEEGEE